jgi:hypothetical protein
MTGNLLDIKKGFFFKYDYQSYKYTIYKEEILLTELSGWKPPFLQTRYAIPLKPNVSVIKESNRFHTGGSQEGNKKHFFAQFQSDWEYFYVLKITWKSFEKGQKTANSRSFGFSSEALCQKFHDTISTSLFPPKLTVSVSIIRKRKNSASPSGRSPVVNAKINFSPKSTKPLRAFLFSTQGTISLFNRFFSHFNRNTSRCPNGSESDSSLLYVEIRLHIGIHRYFPSSGNRAIRRLQLSNSVPTNSRRHKTVTYK